MRSRCAMRQAPVGVHQLRSLQVGRRTWRCRMGFGRVPTRVSRPHARGHRGIGYRSHIIPALLGVANEPAGGARAAVTPHLHTPVPQIIHVMTDHRAPLGLHHVRRKTRMTVKRGTRNG
jgi:hypothetical protein